MKCETVYSSNLIRSQVRFWIKPLLRSLAVLCIVALVGCSSHSGQMAGQGAATGAVVGAVGGMVTGLVFGGNAAESAARGAVWGASTGAVGGAMAGASKDQAEKKAKQQAELEKLKKEIGEDAFSGLAALAECKHEVALGYARTAAKSSNADYALAGLWLEILAYADNQDKDKAQALFPDLVSKDAKISSETQANETTDQALQKLQQIRQEYNLPKTCK